MTFRPPTDLSRLSLAAALPSILVLAAALDLFELGRLSLWYDEVVTMRLARAESPSVLLRLLGEIDATRAPLHPLILQKWLAVFGASDLAGRAFSAVCGVATVFLIFRIGRDIDGPSTGLWGAWLATLSPLLIDYAREARMYAWLVLVTCACWSLLLSRARGGSPLSWFGDLRSGQWRGQETHAERKSGNPEENKPLTTGTCLAYALCLVALGYSHPLGLIMAATLAVASGLFARILFGSWTRWMAVHMVAALLVVPWLGHYLDHPPEHLSGRLPIKFLLGTPIGFIGGNFVTLAGFLAIAGYGITRRLADEKSRERVGPIGLAPVCLLIWMTLPPLALYLYSLVVHPIFGPSRYTLFVAPAYLVLVASGLSRLPVLMRYPLAVGMAGLSAASIVPMVYDPEIKADWRACAASVVREKGSAPTVIVISADPEHNVEVETARYYLPADATVTAFEGLDEANPVIPNQAGARTFLAVGAKRGVPVRPVPERLGPYRVVPDRSFPGLAVFRLERGL